MPTMTTARLENYAHFMGFRACPVCGDILFAAEHAEFVRVDRMILHWRCDTCDHCFQTTAAAKHDAPAHVA